ncbi:MAG TPA: F0F1 ATP synthase subunit B [Microbacteriaceae bacterium]
MLYRILTAEAGETQNPLLPADYDILWSAVVFSVLLLFFWFRVLPSFKKMLDERAQAIEGRLAEAERATAEAAERTDLIEAEQEKLRSEASSIREEARAEGAAILSEMKEQARQESDRIAEVTKTQLEAERQAAIETLRQEVGVLAIDLASKIVGEKLQEDKVANKVVDDFLKEIEKSKG